MMMIRGFGDDLVFGLPACLLNRKKCHHESLMPAGLERFPPFCLNESEPCACRIMFSPPEVEASGQGAPQSGHLEVLPRYEPTECANACAGAFGTPQSIL